MEIYIHIRLRQSEDRDFFICSASALGVALLPALFAILNLLSPRYRCLSALSIVFVLVMVTVKPL